MTTMHTCPRRMSEIGPWERTEGLDEYRADHGMVGQPCGCTFCGSMPPGDFLDAVRAGAEIGPTDKSYKLYIDLPNPTPDKLYVLGTSYQSQPMRDETWVAWDEMTAEQRAVAADYLRGDMHRPTHLKFGPRPQLNAKFYTPHLSPQQSAEFWQLWQSGQVNWGYPGGPYRPLYLPGLPRETGTVPEETP